MEPRVVNDINDLPGLFANLPPDIAEMFKEKLLHCKECNSTKVTTNIVAVLTVLSQSMNKLVESMPLMVMASGVPPLYGEEFY